MAFNLRFLRLYYYIIIGEAVNSITKLIILLVKEIRQKYYFH